MSMRRGLLTMALGHQGDWMQLSLTMCVHVRHTYQTPTLVGYVLVKCSIQKIFVGFLTILAWV